MPHDSLAHFKSQEFAESKLSLAHQESRESKDGPAGWTFDSSDKLLKAGDEFQASYGADSEISYAKLGNISWRKTGPDQYEETNTLTEGWESKKQLNNVTVSIESRFRLKQSDGTFVEVTADYLNAHKNDNKLSENLFVTMGVDVSPLSGGGVKESRPVWIGANWHAQVPFGHRN